MPRWWLPPIAIALLLFLVYALYHRTFYRSLERSIERNVEALRRNDGGEGGDGDEVDRGSAIMRERARLLREGLAVGVDSLPPVRFQSAVGRGGADDDEERAADDAARLLQRECLSTGAYLSPADDYIDCRTYCRVSDGVQYRYFDRADRMLNTGRVTRRGSYCLPTAAAICNTNTSLLMYARDGWRCMSQMRAFAGEGGNRIVACDGRLFDRATGIVWRDFIDPTLKFTDIDERLPTVANNALVVGKASVAGKAPTAANNAPVVGNTSTSDNAPTGDDASTDVDASTVGNAPVAVGGTSVVGGSSTVDSASTPGNAPTGDNASVAGTSERVGDAPIETVDANDDYRFVCPQGSLDPQYNQRHTSPYDRLQQVDNFCASLIPYADRAIRPLFDAEERFNCDCGRDNYYNEETRRCVPYDSPDFDPRTLETTIAVRPCVEMWSRPTSVSGSVLDWHYQPCGVESQSDVPTGSMPAVIRERAQIFDRLVPSPPAMLSSRNR